MSSFSGYARRLVETSAIFMMHHDIMTEGVGEFLSTFVDRRLSITTSHLHDDPFGSRVPVTSVTYDLCAPARLFVSLPSPEYTWSLSVSKVYCFPIPHIWLARSSCKLCWFAVRPFCNGGPRRCCAIGPTDLMCRFLRWLRSSDVVLV